MLGVNSAKSLPVNRDSVVSTSATWVLFVAVILAALFLRLIFYTGFFGSDEVIYTGSAFKLLDGDWSVSTYVGANRYGINLPVAGFAYVFGRHELAANLYALLLSLGEVALVFYVGLRMFGIRAAVLAAAVLAFLPIHAYYAGRLNPDAPLAFMMTASFVLFWHGETIARSRAKVLSFLAAGMAAGAVFWIKPVVIIYVFVFLLYPILFGRWTWLWVWAVLGFILVAGLNFIFFWNITGNFFFLVDAMSERMADGHLESEALEGSDRMSGPAYYLSYLFVKIYHTWMLGFTALGAAAIWFLRRNSIESTESRNLGFVAFWGLGVLAVFSFFVVSLDPFFWIPKQTNYMLMFVAPIALLAGYALASIRGYYLWIALAFVLVPAIILTGMRQAYIHTFTANSKATVEFAIQVHPAMVYGGTNAIMAAKFESLMQYKSSEISIHSVADFLKDASAFDSPHEAAEPRFVVLDWQTQSWGRDNPISNSNEIPGCWVHVKTLEPIGFGVGWKILRELDGVISMIPGSIPERVSGVLDDLTKPKKAEVFLVDTEKCRVLWN